MSESLHAWPEHGHRGTEPEPRSASAAGAWANFKLRPRPARAQAPGCAAAVSPIRSESESQWQRRHGDNDYHSSMPGGAALRRPAGGAGGRSRRGPQRARSDWHCTSVVGCQVPVVTWLCPGPCWPGASCPAAGGRYGRALAGVSLRVLNIGFAAGRWGG